MSSALGEVLAWILVFVLASVLNSTEWGHTIIYYLLALAILFLLLFNSKGLAEALAPIVSKAGGKADTSQPAQAVIQQPAPASAFMTI